jgi:hypothetical protein
VSEAEEKFEALAEELDANAWAIKCSLEEYLEGLGVIRGRIDVAIESAQADIKARATRGK